MPLQKVGNNTWYIGNDETPYESEAVYYLNFYIVSALAAIEYIENGFESCKAAFRNRCQYYHYHTDHLLYSIGQISGRLCITGKEKGLVLERKQSDTVNFQFNDDKFPILSDRRTRNTIEHINEYNQVIIKEFHGVGGFNVIDDKCDEALLKALYERRGVHPYTLDLLQKKIYITRKSEELTIDMDSLRKELLLLRENVVYFRSFLTFFKDTEDESNAD